MSAKRKTSREPERREVYWEAFHGVVRAFYIGSGMSGVEADLAALNARAKQELAR